MRTFTIDLEGKTMSAKPHATLNKRTRTSRERNYSILVLGERRNHPMVGAWNEMSLVLAYLLPFRKG